MTDQEKTAVRRKIAQCAQKALLYEVSVTPKPGLVDRADNGAHRDMDFFTFLDSAAVLTPYFEACAAAGLEAAGTDDAGACEALLAKLRGPGKEAEREMLRATGGVNTHKGAIFLLGLLTAAAGYCLGRREEKFDADQILKTAGRIAAPALGDFADAPAARPSSGEPENEAGAETAGLKAYRADGSTGVRGEAAAGFPSVKHAALPALKKALADGKSVNDAGAEALLKLILAVDDTTLLKRCGSRAAMETERTLLRELLAIYTPAETARHLNDRWSEKGYSAGGCADLLGAAFFLLFTEKTFASRVRNEGEAYV